MTNIYFYIFFLFYHFTIKNKEQFQEMHIFISCVNKNHGTCKSLELLSRQLSKLSGQKFWNPHEFDSFLMIFEFSRNFEMKRKELYWLCTCTSRYQWYIISMMSECISYTQSFFMQPCQWWNVGAQKKKKWTYSSHQISHSREAERQVQQVVLQCVPDQEELGQNKHGEREGDGGLEE